MLARSTRLMSSTNELFSCPLTGGIGVRTQQVSGPLASILSPPPVPSKLPLEERFKLCKAVADFGGEITVEEELLALLRAKASPICYDGFEPSGRMHLAQGVMKSLNVNRLTEAGCVFVFWVADWFALMNNKMGGDLHKIQRVGQYFVEVWKALGMNMENVRFLWASEEINKDPSGYWIRVMNIARANTIARINRCSQIMGREAGEDQKAAQILYPCMQAADVFYLGVDICQLGKDQRKVNMLAREFLDSAECLDKRDKPIILSHGMVPGLVEGQEKMSKSDPDSAIFMEDSVEDVNRKIKKAFCPPGIIQGNPCTQYVQMLVFPVYNKFEIIRSEKNGGNVLFQTTEAFNEAYLSGAIHPGDLKASLAAVINQMIEPVRKHFREDPFASQLLAEIRSYKVTK